MPAIDRSLSRSLIARAPTIHLLLKADVPCVFTAFDEGEAARAEVVLTRPTAAPRRSSSGGALDLRASFAFGPELNKFGSLLRRFASKLTKFVSQTMNVYLK